MEQFPTKNHFHWFVLKELWTQSIALFQNMLSLEKSDKSYNENWDFQHKNVSVHASVYKKAWLDSSETNVVDRRQSPQT